MDRKISLSSPYWDGLLYTITAAGLLYAVFHSLLVPNVILEQGMSHRIFYLHVPIAWVALYGPILSFFFSVIYLSTKKLVWDQLAYTANQLAFLFAIGVLFSGPIWAYSAWGVPWDKTDARLQSFFILCVSLLSYFIFRFLVPSRAKKAILSAYLSLLCAISAVLTWGAIRWIENPGNHPSSVLGKGGMQDDMRYAMWVSVFAYHFLFVLFFVLVRRSIKLEEIKQNLRSEWNG